MVAKTHATRTTRRICRILQEASNCKQDILTDCEFSVTKTRFSLSSCLTEPCGSSRKTNLRMPNMYTVNPQSSRRSRAASFETWMVKHSLTTPSSRCPSRPLDRTSFALRTSLPALCLVRKNSQTAWSAQFTVLVLGNHYNHLVVGTLQISMACCV